MKGENKGFRPLMWNPDEQHIFVRIDKRIYSGMISDIRFDLTPSDNLPDSAVVFDPSARIRETIAANANVHAVRVADLVMTEGAIQ